LIEDETKLINRLISYIKMLGRRTVNNPKQPKKRSDLTITNPHPVPQPPMHSFAQIFLNLPQIIIKA
jgi:hypothetical protein